MSECPYCHSNHDHKPSCPIELGLSLENCLECHYFVKGPPTPCGGCGYIGKDHAKDCPAIRGHRTILFPVMGDCHRYPTSVGPIRSTHWCGEFKPVDCVPSPKEAK